MPKCTFLKIIIIIIIIINVFYVIPSLVSTVHMSSLITVSVHGG